MRHPKAANDAIAEFTLAVLLVLLLATASCVKLPCSRSDTHAMTAALNSAALFDKRTLGRWSMTSCLLASRVQYAMRANKAGVIDAGQLHRIENWYLGTLEEEKRGGKTTAGTVPSRYKDGWCISIVELDPEHRSSFYEYLGMVRVLVIEGDGPAPWIEKRRWRADLERLRVGVEEHFVDVIGNLEGVLDSSSKWIRHERELLAVQAGELIIERQAGRPDSCYSVRVNMRGAMRETLMHRSPQRDGSGFGYGRSVTDRTRCTMNRSFRGLDLQAPILIRVPRTGVVWVRPSWRKHLAARVWPSSEGDKVITSPLPAGIKQADWLLYHFTEADMRPLVDWDREKKAGIK